MLAVEFAAILGITFFGAGVIIRFFRHTGITENHRGSPIETIIFSIVVIISGAFLVIRVRKYNSAEDNNGEALTRHKRRLMIIGIICAMISVVVLVSALVDESKSVDRISGTKLQTLMRSQFVANPGSSTLINTIACADRSYGDGDVARCSVKLKDGSSEIIMVTVLRENGEWRLVASTR